MKKIVTNIKTAVVAVIGLIGGIFWGYSSNWQAEPTILLSVSAIELIAFGMLRSVEESDGRTQVPSPVGNHGNVNVNMNVEANNMAQTDSSSSDKTDTSLVASPIGVWVLSPMNVRSVSSCSDEYCLSTLLRL